MTRSLSPKTSLPLLCGLVLLVAACGKIDTPPPAKAQPKAIVVEESMPTQDVPAPEPRIKLVNPELFSRARPFSLANYCDRMVLLEFWATWCSPCRESVPHLSKLQAQYGDKLAVVGVSQEDEPTVRKFYLQNRGHMAYRVALDLGSTWNDYMVANNQLGIPHAFLIFNGKVVWQGHPLNSKMEDELAKLSMKIKNKNRR